jgi:hypothetical protein
MAVIARLPWRRAAAVSILVPVLLYGAGLFHWYRFFNGGKLSFRVEDWPKEYAYYAVLREAVRSRTLPYHIAGRMQGTDRFLAIPEVNLSPQILLLPYLSTGQFLVVNVALLYTAGFAGCLLLRRALRLSTASFAVFFLLFNFNGHITSHLAVGHSMWAGYFLLPYFLLALRGLLRTGPPLLPAAGMALVLAAVLLQGTFHLFVWCLLFLAVLAAASRTRRKAVLAAVGLSLLVSLFRLVPAAVAFGGRKQAFVTGYPTLADLVAAFTVIRGPGYPELISITGPGHWWEFDFYTGIPALLFLLYFGVGRRERFPDPGWRALAVPVLALTVLSLNYFYAGVTWLPLPLLSGERVSSRFLVLPFVVLLAGACVRFDALRPRLPGGAAARIVFCALLAQTAFALATHSWHWRLAALEARVPAGPPPWAPALARRPDPLYTAGVTGGLAGSAAALAAVPLLGMRRRRGDARTAAAEEMQE